MGRLTVGPEIVLHISLPMKIEFSISVPDIERAHSLAVRIAAQGYIPDIFVDNESGSVSIYQRAKPTSCCRARPCGAF